MITKCSPMAKPEPLTAAVAVVDDKETKIDNDDDIADEIEGDFYDETVRLQLIGYLRLEQKFDSFPELIAQIHLDIGNANWALDSMPFVLSREDEFVKGQGRRSERLDRIGGRRFRSKLGIRIVVKCRNHRSRSRSNEVKLLVSLTLVIHFLQPF